MTKFGSYEWKDVYQYPYALYLSIFVRVNYWKRKRGLLPDEWYWADRKMADMGYFLNW